MVEVFTGELPRNAEQNAASTAAQDCCQKFLDDSFQPPKLQKVNEAQADKPVKDVPGAAIGADGYLKYHGLHLPTWNSKNPDGSPAKPFVDENGKARVDGKLQPATDSKGQELGVDGQPVFDQSGLRRYDKSGSPVATQLEASDPQEMAKKLQSNDPLNDQSRAAYNKVIESADKLDRVELTRTIEQNEKWVMSHTTAYLWETGYQQAQKQLAELSADLAKNPSPEKQAEVKSKQAEIAAKDDELKQKPNLAEQVGRMREANASDEQSGRLIMSAADSRSNYLNKLLEQGSVKKYVSLSDKGTAEAKALEADPNVAEARKVVKELGSLNVALPPELKSTAKSLGLGDGQNKK